MVPPLTCVRQQSGSRTKYDPSIRSGATSATRRACFLGWGGPFRAGVRPGARLRARRLARRSEGTDRPQGTGTYVGTPVVATRAFAARKPRLAPFFTSRLEPCRALRQTPDVGLFWNGHGERLAELERLVASLTARVVKAEATAADCAERAYRYMKKAESRARRELDTPGESGAVGAAPAATPPASSSRRGLWGARGRRAMRLAAPDPLLSLDADEVNGNGLHS